MIPHVKEKECARVGNAALQRTNCGPETVVGQTSWIYRLDRRPEGPQAESDDLNMFDVRFRTPGDSLRIHA